MSNNTWRRKFLHQSFNGWCFFYAIFVVTKEVILWAVAIGWWMKKLMTRFIVSQNYRKSKRWLLKVSIIILPFEKGRNYTPFGRYYALRGLCLEKHFIHPFVKCTRDETKGEPAFPLRLRCRLPYCKIVSVVGITYRKNYPKA